MVTQALSVEGLELRFGEVLGLGWRVMIFHDAMQVKPLMWVTYSDLTVLRIGGILPIKTS